MHLRRQQNCWSLRCSWSIDCRRCSNYISILNLTPGFNELGKDNCKTRWETFESWDLVSYIRDLTVCSVGEKHRTHRTFPMARPKCLMGDFTNLYGIYTAHQTNVWWTMQVFRLHWVCIANFSLYIRVMAEQEKITVCNFLNIIILISFTGRLIPWVWEVIIGPDSV